ncbi:hypothetical protein BS78_10G158700 [Paspalum vaginatum]|nr:hypothetical protein BS78_10G158700 [Paspalum vaginatum]
MTHLNYCENNCKDHDDEQKKSLLHGDTVVIMFEAHPSLLRPARAALQFRNHLPQTGGGPQAAGDPRSRQRIQPDRTSGRNPIWNAMLRFTVSAGGAGSLHVLLRAAS